MTLCTIYLTCQDSNNLSWSVGGVPQGSPRRGGPAGGSGSGRGGGDGSEGGAERLHDTHLQQQIILALRRLREDMRSVMDRLEAVERLAATHVSTYMMTALIFTGRNPLMFNVKVDGQFLLALLMWS